MNEGDTVWYTGEYENCRNHKYVITRLYTTIIGGNVRWVDLKAVDPDILTHYDELLSVDIGDIIKCN